MKKSKEILSPESLNDLEFKDFKSVSGVFFHLVFRRYALVTSLFGVFVIVLALFLFAVVEFVIFNIFAIFSSILIYAGIFAAIAERWFMGNFAKTIGFKYEGSAPLSTVSGKIFEIGSSRSITNVISGEYKGHPFRLFHYKYVQRIDGRRDKTFPFTVMEITFEDIRFPHMALRSRRMPKFFRSGKDELEISLEDEFRSHFQLFCKDNYQIEALQIFNTDTLTLLRDTASDFSIEFADNKVYIYDNIHIRNKKDLHELYEVSEKIFDSIGPLIIRLSGHFDVMHKYFRS